MAGTSSHKTNAGPAPNSWRIGLRKVSTSISAIEVKMSEPRSVSVMSVNPAFDVVKQPAQFGNVLGAQFFLLAEVGHQRCDAAVE